MNAYNPARRLVVVAAVAVVGLLAGASPASAALTGPNCTWNPKFGCAWFDARGDRFYVCDYNSDGNSIVAQYVYMKGGRVRVGYARSKGRAVSDINKGRDCSRNVEDHREGSRFRARTCMAYNAKPGGKPIRVIETTCGGWWNGRF